MTIKQIRTWEVTQRINFNNNDLPQWKINLLNDSGFDFENQLIKNVLPFEIARKFVRDLKFKGTVEWNEYLKSGNRPENIPSHPNRKYELEWISLGDWLGTTPGFGGTYLSYDDAKKIIHPLKLQSSFEYRDYCKSGKKPHNIPFAPQQTYIGKGWISFGDFLGNGVIASFNNKYLPFESARSMARQLNLKTGKEWRNYCDSVKLPVGMPNAPWHVYKDDGFISMGDWLGTGNIANYNKKFITYNKCKEFAIQNKIKSAQQWNDFFKQNHPTNIPQKPARNYKNKGWKSWGDFLGTGSFGPKSNNRYMSFKKARKIVRTLDLSNRQEWTKLKNKPKNIPVVAHIVYKDKGWIDWYDFLGITKEKSREIQQQRIWKSRIQNEPH
jgi:hypothetical protein